MKILKITVVDEATSEVLEEFYTNEHRADVANGIQDALSCYDSKQELEEAVGDER